MIRRSLVVSLILCAVVTALGCGRSDKNVLSPDRGIEVVRGEEALRLQGEVTTIDFEDLPPNASSCPAFPGGPTIENPLTIKGVVFTDPHCLSTGFCSAPTCPEGNVALILNQSSRIEVRPRNRGVVLEIEGMGDVPFVIEATDQDGNTTTVEGLSVIWETVALGFRSPSGIAELRITRVGPVPPDCPVAPCGPLVLGRVTLEK